MSMDGFAAGGSGLQTGFGRRFFPGAKRSEVLDQIQHLVNYGNMVINISADEGMGKSYMLEAVNGVYSGRVMNVRATMLMSTMELLNQVLSAVLTLRFHHDTPDFSTPASEEELSAVIASYLSRVQDSGETVVLLVDDAHELSEEALRALLNLVVSDSVNGFFKCVLFSEPYLNQLLKKPGLEASGADRVFSISLNHLNQTEVADYLDFVEASKPETERILYTDKDIKQIFELSQGKLGQIKPAVKSLLEKTSPPPASSSFQMLGMVGLVTLVVIFGVLAVLYNNSAPEFDSVDVVDVTESEAKPLLPKVISGGELAEVERPIPDANKQDEKSSSLLEKLKQQQSEMSKLNTNDLLVEKDDDKAGESGAMDSQETLESKVESQPLVNKVEVVFNPEPKAAEPEIMDHNLLSGNEWVMAQLDGHITFQVLGAHSKKNVDRYVDNFKGDSTKLVVYEAKRAGKPWFVLVHGSYTSRSEAEQAAVKQGFKVKSVWFRSFKSVKQEINKS